MVGALSVFVKVDGDAHVVLSILVYTHTVHLVCTAGKVFEVAEAFEVLAEKLVLSLVGFLVVEDILYSADVVAVVLILVVAEIFQAFLIEPLVLVLALLLVESHLLAFEWKLHK